MTDSDERLPTPAEGADGEPILSEGVGGVPDIPDEERATVGDADEVNVDTDEPQTELNRSPL
jgi:hypothetical protein